MTVRRFISRMMYTNENPGNISDVRWQAMLQWFENRLKEGIDIAAVYDTLS